MSSDHATIASQLQYVPIAEQSWYVLPGAHIYIGGKFVGALSSYSPTTCIQGGSSPSCTILDSGTTLNLVSTSIWTFLVDTLVKANSNLPAFGEDFWQVTNSDNQVIARPCTALRLPGLPDITIKLLNSDQKTVATTLTLSSNVYFKSVGDGQCIFGFKPTTSNQHILGQTAMESSYIHFDRKNNRIGFAPNTGMCGN